jgi:hypothetical protein
MKILIPSAVCLVTELVEVLPWSLIFKLDCHEREFTTLIMKILIPSAVCPVTERSRSELVEVLPSALFSE